MLEFCPLCNKNGYKRKIILRQINLQEAVWLCEYSECPWPFGSEDFTFVLRKVGETCSSEWELRKPAISKSPESIQIFLAELGLDTPPVTPGSGTELVHKDSVFGENTSSVTSLKLSGNSAEEIKPNSGCLNNSKRKLRHFNTSENGSVYTESKRSKINDIHNSNVGVISIDRDSENQASLNCDNPNFKDEKTSRGSKNGFSLNVDSNSETLDKYMSGSRRFIDACDAAEALTKSVFNISSKPSIDNLPIHESTVKCKKWLSDNTKGTVIGDHCYLSESKKLDIENSNNPSEVLDIRLKSNSAKNSNSVKRLPKIKSIKKTNVRLEQVIPTFIQQRFKEQSNSSLANVEVADLTETVEIKTEEKIKRTNTDDSSVHCDNSRPNIHPESEMGFKNSKLQNRTIDIDGLFPIKLSYEIPSFLENFIPVPCSTDYREKAKEENVEIGLAQDSTVVNNSVMSIDVEIKTAECLENKNNESSISGKSDTRKQSIKKPLKKTIPKFGKYQGFSFGVLKKKCKSNITSIEDNLKSSIPNVLSPDNVSSCSDVTWTSETSSATTTTVDSRSESVDSGVYTNSKSSSNVENYSPGTLSSDLMKSSSTFSPQNDGILESSFNLDQVIDDLLLSETEDLTKSFQDDWLESLFQ